MRKKIQIIILSAMVALTFAVPSAASFAATTPKLQMTFIDVGAGDCTYVELPDGTDILIDAGLSGKGEKVVKTLKSMEKSMDLEYVISTHPDADHCGGLQTVFKEMKVKRFYYPSDVAYSTATAKNVIALAKAEKDCKVYKISKAKRIINKDDGDVQVRFIQSSTDYKTSNADSLMTYIKYKNFDALVAGDVEGDAQTAGKKYNMDVLLVPHHGSNGTSSKAFIDRYDPEKIVISTDGVKYGHPSQETINRYFAHDSKMKMYRTDKCGTITLKSSGSGSTFDCKSVPQYSSGTSGTKDPVSIADSTTVYITPSGTKYHLNENCRGLANASKVIKTTKGEAEAEGLTLCGYED